MTGDDQGHRRESEYLTFLHLKLLSRFSHIRHLYLQLKYTEHLRRLNKSQLYYAPAVLERRHCIYVLRLDSMLGSNAPQDDMNILGKSSDFLIHFVHFFTFHDQGIPLSDSDHRSGIVQKELARDSQL